MVLLQGNRGIADVEAASEAFAKAVRMNPRHAPSQLGLARTSLNLWQTQQDPRRRVVAQRAIQAAMDLGLRTTTTSLLKADIDIASGDPAAALKSLEKLISVENATDDVYRTKARALLAAGKRAEAVESARQAVKLNPLFSMNYNMLGITLRAAGRPLDAIVAFEKVVELNPSSTVGFSNLGGARVGAGRFVEAIPPLEQALRRTPTATQYSNLGMALLYVGSCASAIEVFKKAHELSPDNDTILGNLADAYFCSGRTAEATSNYGQAIQLAEKELKSTPGNYVLAGRLSMYLAKSGRLDRARTHLNEALRLAPGDGTLLFYQSLLWTFEHQYERAAASREAAIRAGYSPAVADAERKLYEGRFPELRTP
jgi:tetratricopeptide (TPR) repeat protein